MSDQSLSVVQGGKGAAERGVVLDRLPVCSANAKSPLALHFEVPIGTEGWVGGDTCNPSCLAGLGWNYKPKDSGTSCGRPL